MEKNIKFVTIISTFAVWLAILWFCSDDIHPTGHSSSFSSDNFYPRLLLCHSIFDALSQHHRLSIVYCNVQSIVSKLDILQTELYAFDNLAFTETWPVNRPPNAVSAYFTVIEDSSLLAVDRGLNDIIVTGDFNYSLLSLKMSREVISLCSQLAFHQSNNRPLIYIIPMHIKNHLMLSGIGENFLGQSLSSH